MSTASTLAHLHPTIFPLVVECQRSDRIRGKLAVTGIKSSILNDTSTVGICDRFILFIPYCGAFIKWEIVFDCNLPTLPPDIVFIGDESFFIPSLDNLKSFTEWDVTNTKCLVFLIEEILQEYRKHQLNGLSAYQQIEFQYDTLKERFDEQMIDVKLNSGKNETLIKFYISLDVDYTAIPSYLKKESPCDCYAALSITFNGSNSSKAKVEKSLFLSPGLERILGSENAIKLPKWNEDTYLLDYIPAVTILLQEKVNFLLESFIKRKEYLASLLNVLGYSVLEYDTESYKMVSLLFDYQGFCFVSQVLLTNFFPNETPLLSLFSIYHKLDGQPVQVNVSLPYSSQTEADINIKKMINHIVHIAPQFMEVCKNKGTLL